MTYPFQKIRPTDRGLRQGLQAQQLKECSTISCL
jgi:hypothetical protein